MQRAVNLFHIEEAELHSPFVHRVWRSRSEPEDAFISVAATHWEIVFTRMKNETWVTVRGPETRASTVAIPQDAEFIGVRFAHGAFMPRFPLTQLVDAAEWLPVRHTRKAFWFDQSSWEIPTYDNADVFVERLVRKGLLVRDPLVAAIYDGGAHDRSLRTAQRRVLRATGLTLAALRQIERAHEAVALLDRGTPILDVVERMGYADQPHLTRALRRFAGQTPAEILRGGA